MQLALCVGLEFKKTNMLHMFHSAVLFICGIGGLQVSDDNLGGSGHAQAPCRRIWISRAIRRPSSAFMGSGAQAMLGTAAESRCLQDVRKDVAFHMLGAGMDAPPSASSPMIIDDLAATPMLDFNVFDAGASSAGSPPKKRRQGMLKQTPTQDEPHPTQEPAVRPKGGGRGRGSGATPSGEPSAQGGKSEKKKGATELQKGMDLLRDLKNKYSDANLWNNRPKKRVLDNAIKSLGETANKLLTTGEEGSMDCSQQLNDFCLQLESKQELFSAIAKSPKDYVTRAMDEASQEVLLRTDTTVLTNIIIYVATECLRLVDTETTLEEGSKLFFKVCAFNSEPIISIRTLKLRQDAAEIPWDSPTGGDPEAATAALQQIIASMWLDRVCRARLLPKIKEMVNA